MATITQEDKINAIGLNLGLSLCKQGEYLITNSTKINYQTATKYEVEDAINRATGIDKKSISMQDQKYYTTDWETWKGLIAKDWSDTKQYLTDRYDCDNFADYFNARMAYLYGLNTSGRFSNNIYDAKTGKYINAHRASIIVAFENGGLVPYIFEPMTDGFVKANTVKNVIGSWDYKGHYIEVN